MPRATPNVPAASRRAGDLAAASGRAFTLMEMLVAVAAVAVVSVGLASIFDAVGKTVAGGKRVSVLNTYAGLVESRLRRDFDRMSREGFLMIRQQWVNDGTGRLYVPTSDAQKLVDARARRVDEIVFFTKGASESGRIPVGSDVITGTPLAPSGDAARVYYGHGQRVQTANAAFNNPSPGDLNPPVVSGEPVVALGVRVNVDPSLNPNYYAGSWSLLRHETTLSRPRTTTGPVGDYQGVGLALGAPATLDSDFQVAGQPAAASVFRSHNRWYPGAGPLPAWLHPASANPAAAVTPRFASGLVDTATTDFEEIRAWVTSGTLLPGIIEDPTTPGALLYPNRRMVCAPVAFPTSGTLPVSTRSTTPNPIDWQHAWMDDAWPTQSAVLPTGNTWNDNPAPSAMPGAGGLDPGGARLRYEPQSPDLFTALQSGTPLLQATQRADQLMLASNVFVPRCSEFIVEWSFGDSMLNGEPVWFGLPRNAGAVNEVYPYPYTQTSRGAHAVHTRPVRLATSAIAMASVSDRLIYGYSPDEQALALTSYFGYTDPTIPTPADVDSNGQIDNATPARTQPWPWPRLIRITVVLSDPQDPSIESTFQYVFTTPADPGSN